jgi:DNA-binding MarR family transcriptional regulator
MIKPIQQVLNGLSDYEYHVKHLEILNPVLPAQLTKKEIEVLAGFMSLQGDLVEKDRFGTQARKTIREKLSMSPGGLSNHLRELKNKFFIYEGENGKYRIKEFLIPNDKVQGYQFKIQKA